MTDCAFLGGQGASNLLADPFAPPKQAQGEPQASKPLPDDFFSAVAQPQPAPSMGMALSQQQQGSSGFGAFGQPGQGFASFGQPSGHSPTWQHQQQQGFGTFQQPSMGLNQAASGSLGFGQFGGAPAQTKLGGQVSATLHKYLYSQWAASFWWENSRTAVVEAADLCHSDGVSWDLCACAGILKFGHKRSIEPSSAATGCFLQSKGSFCRLGCILIGTLVGGSFHLS